MTLHPEHVSPHARHWDLDPGVTFLNHGSFGACPRVVLEEQSELRARMERQPVQFFATELEGLFDEVRSELGMFVGAPPDDLALVANATSGVNTVLKSLELGPRDELLVTDHEYNACRNALNAVAERSGARVVVAPVPFPLQDEVEVTAAILDKVTDRTQLLLVDHITSPTGVVLPIEAIVAQMRERGIDTLVDGAHAPGMQRLRLHDLGAAYYTGNCHKWLCTPKGAAFLYVRRDRQERIRPLSISHGANSPRTDRSRFRIEFDWTGTADPTPWLCIPTAIRFLRGLFPGGFPELREHNRELVLRGRSLLCDALRSEPPCPASMIGSLAAVILPHQSSGPPKSPLYLDPLHDELLTYWQIEVPVIPWPSPPVRLLRISGQAYNEPGQYQRLAEVIAQLLG